MTVLDGIRSRVPLVWRHRIAKNRIRYRQPTGRWRALPDALIIGAQRSGTSSLYRYLGGHPDVAPSFRKEIEYFSRYHHRGEGWYRAHFELALGRRHLRFEATPDYLFHPLAPARAAALVPEAKLIVLLREPVARALSHYRHMVVLGHEPLSFAAAIDAEAERCADDLGRLAANPDHEAVELLRYSYVARGRYAEQLTRWFEHFPRERFLVLRSEDLFTDPARGFASVLDFLELPRWVPAGFGNVSRPGGGSDPVPPPAPADRLTTEFAVPNRRLAELLGTDAPRW